MIGRQRIWRLIPRILVCWVVTTGAIAQTNSLMHAVLEFRSAYRDWDRRGFVSAERQLDRVIRLHPDSFDAHYWQAVARFHQLLLRRSDGEELTSDGALPLSEGVVDALGRALEIRPDNAECHAMLSAVYGMQIAAARRRAFTLGPRVVQHGKRTLKLEPDSPRAYYLLGTSLYHGPGLLGGKEKALDLFEKAHVLFKAEEDRDRERPATAPRWGHADCLVFMAMTCRELNRPEEARRYVTQALALSSTSTRARTLLEQLQEKDGGAE